MVCVCKYIISSFTLALIPAMSLEYIKFDREINRIPFVTSLVILCLLPGTCHPSREILSSESIRADGVEISEIYHFNNAVIQNHICIAQDTMKMLHLSIQTCIKSF